MMGYAPDRAILAAGQIKSNSPLHRDYSCDKMLSTMATNVEVVKGANENNASIMRRFRKRVQDSGVLPRVRGLRYSERVLSHYKRKMKTLESLAHKADVARQIKLGKLPEKTRE